MRVPSTEVQNNFGKFLKYAEAGEEIIVTRNGKDSVSMTAIPDISLREEAALYAGSGDRVTYEEFLELTENSELRYELIDGIVYNLASPSFKHQHAIHELHGTFYNWFKGKSCTPMTSPFDIKLIKSADNICVVQPDLFVICDPSNVDNKGKYLGLPALVVEVLSPSTRSKDLLKKLDLYLECDIREYWIVNPDQDQVLVYAIENKQITRTGMFSKSTHTQVTSFHFEGLAVDIQELFH